ncbi:MAG: metal-dependent hydrolase [Fuerstiella sp.]|nr:metal-dependent hydrolase [Fuerstiella sp.]MCP4511225.1 metal-dependent hydrolase [Fuerstiella sp.]MDG2131555.1 metal-dependent hydrolase [Fuerstiella sp.]
MTTKITWLGHSTFHMEASGKSILIDPFFEDNPVAQVAADDVGADVIIVTHGHGDHVGDTVRIAKRTGALVISNFEIVTWLQNQGVANAHPMHVGGSHDFDFGTVKLTIAHHGSSLPDGSNGGSPTGIVLKTQDGNIYFAGDTGLFSDMKLIGEEDLEVAIIPVGDNFTMGPDDSIRATQFLQPRTVIPCHYNTWPLIEQDINDWSRRIAADTSAQPAVLKIGEHFEL